MKYLKLFENIDWEEDWEEDDENKGWEDYINPITSIDVFNTSERFLIKVHKDDILKFIITLHNKGYTRHSNMSLIYDAPKSRIPFGGLHNRIRDNHYYLAIYNDKNVTILNKKANLDIFTIIDYDSL